MQKTGNKKDEGHALPQLWMCSGGPGQATPATDSQANRSANLLLCCTKKASKF